MCWANSHIREPVQMNIEYKEIDILKIQDRLSLLEARQAVQDAEPNL